MLFRISSNRRSLISFKVNAYYFKYAKKFKESKSEAAFDVVAKVSKVYSQAHSHWH